MPTIDELKYLTERRLEAADVLNDNSLYDIVYHDSGYIIEFGLKVAICRNMGLDRYPELKEDNRIFRTHHFDSLVKLAGLTDALTKKKVKDKTFMKNWSLSSQWSTERRYQPVGENGKEVAENFLHSIKSEQGGVLPWIKEHW